MKNNFKTTLQRSSLGEVLHRNAEVFSASSAGHTGLKLVTAEAASHCGGFHEAACSLPRQSLSRTANENLLDILCKGATEVVLFLLD